jgi:hypothetical protein
MVHPDDRARVYGNYLRRMRGEQVEPFYRFRALSSSGETRWLQISAVRDRLGGPARDLNFLTDVTEQVALQAHLTETLAEREAILEMTAVGIMFIQAAASNGSTRRSSRGCSGSRTGRRSGTPARSPSRTTPTGRAS